MTTHKHLKARVRARMAKTGERYAVAREHVAGDSSTTQATPHLPGAHPETTVLRNLVSRAGFRDADGHPPGEAMMLAVGGGIGAGVFAFHYEREAFSSLFLAGQHRWEDPPAFLDAALRRLGLEPIVRETGSRKAADAHLRELLDAGRPVAAFLDAAELGTRGLPAEASGGSYHVVTVHSIDGETALVGDLAPEPTDVPLDQLARARARIGKYRNRLVAIAPAEAPIDLPAAARTGVAAGAEALATESRRNFSLRAFEDLAERMTATSGSTGWGVVFPRGRLLWTALSSIHRFVGAEAPGGGLLRPLFAEALTALRGLRDVGERYAALGDAWADLARAALPADVAPFDETRRLQQEIAARMHAGGPDTVATNAAAFSRLDELRAEADRDFPLSDAATHDLLADLAERLRRIHEAEVAALDELRAATA